MALFQANPSALTRYRPAVFVVIGAATVYCVLLAYNYATEQSQPTKTLRRRGAVHRRRENVRSAYVEDASARSSRRQAISPEEMDDFIEIGSNHLPQMDRIRREFDWNNPELEIFRTVVARRSIESFLRSEHARGQRHDDLLIFQNMVLVKLEELGIPPAEILTALRQARLPSLKNIAITDRAIRSILVMQDDANFRNQPRADRAAERSRRLGELPLRISDLPGRSDSTDLKSVLFFIAEEQSRKQGYVHRGIRCDSCGEMPIRGIRWHCSNCTDFDLCSTCESQNPGPHNKTHVFHKIVIPALHLSKSWKVEPVWYPGNPYLMARQLQKGIVKQLAKDCGYDQFEVEAIYDQFTCIADTEWKDDPLNINAAISREAFYRSIMPHTQTHPVSPILIYERCFAFYDTDNNGLIGFDEFLHGLAYIHQKAFRDQKLLKIFDGFDIDSDGYINRRDFLRVFRSLYVVQQELTNDMVAVQGEQAADEPRDVLLNSTQPLSSAFRERFQVQNSTRRSGKFMDRYGDRIPYPGNRDYFGSTPPTKADVITELELKENERTQYPPNVFDEQAPRRIIPMLAERWERRQFYTDEEEGVTAAQMGVQPPEMNEVQEEAPSSATGEHQEDDEVSPQGADFDAQRSRSSSRVRFKDELEDDTRSQTSTSSRPIGERWGGFEMPDVEVDVGREVMYNVIQEAFNKLLDPLFKPSEDLTLEVQRTKSERVQWKNQTNLAKKEEEAIETYKASSEHDFIPAQASPPPKDHIYSLWSDPTIDDLKHQVDKKIPGDILSKDDWKLIKNCNTAFDGILQSAETHFRRGQDIRQMPIYPNLLRQAEEGQAAVQSVLSKIKDAFPGAPTAHAAHGHLQGLFKQLEILKDLPPVPPFGIEEDSSSYQDYTDSESSAEEHTREDDAEDDHVQASEDDATNNDPLPEHYDPTLPQFRPTSPIPTETTSSASSPGFSRWLPSPTSPHHPFHAFLSARTAFLHPPAQPSYKELLHLAYLSATEADWKARGAGGGKIDFEQFEKAMKEDQEGKLDFLDEWLSLIGF
ncbi:MAG: hypothetical protein M1820_006191 [Bogoriella megaspora]|nr:MAG: hypothetical protein M1820_006191 [Bogoriella megaspora]